MCLLHLCLTTTSVLRLTTISKTKYASAKRSVLLHFLRIPFLKESNCRSNELHCLLAHLHRTLITFSFLCNKSTYVTRVFSNFSDYTNITVQLRQNHATSQFTLMFLMLPHSPFLIRHYI